MPYDLRRPYKKEPSERPKDIRALSLTCKGIRNELMGIWNFLRNPRILITPFHLGCNSSILAPPHVRDRCKPEVEDWLSCLGPEGARALPSLHIHVAEHICFLHCYSTLGHVKPATVALALAIKGVRKRFNPNAILTIHVSVSLRLGPGPRLENVGFAARVGALGAALEEVDRFLEVSRKDGATTEEHEAQIFKP